MVPELGGGGGAFLKGGWIELAPELGGGGGVFLARGWVIIALELGGGGGAFITGGWAIFVPELGGGGGAFLTGGWAIFVPELGGDGGAFLTTGWVALIPELGGGGGALLTGGWVKLAPELGGGGGAFRKGAWVIFVPELGGGGGVIFEGGWVRLAPELGGGGGPRISLFALSSWFLFPESKLSCVSKTGADNLCMFLFNSIILFSKSFFAYFSSPKSFSNLSEDCLSLSTSSKSLFLSFSIIINLLFISEISFALFSLILQLNNFSSNSYFSLRTFSISKSLARIFCSNKSSCWTFASNSFWPSTIPSSLNSVSFSIPSPIVFVSFFVNNNKEFHIDTPSEGSGGISVRISKNSMKW